jgi:hypothetical protein
MLELTGMGSVLRSIGLLYWLLAACAIYLAISKGKSRCAKVVWTLVAIIGFGFIPVRWMIEKAQRDAYALEAWAYFKKKCETEAGEKIYKTYTGIKSVLVVKPLPPATEKDLYDQFWYGDPYSAPAHSQRGKYEASILASQNAPASFGSGGPGFKFVEYYVSGDGEAAEMYVKYSYPVATGELQQVRIDRPTSRFYVSWEDISNTEDRKYWVAGSRLRIVDSEDNSTVAERIGYLIEGGFGLTSGGRRPWLAARAPNTTCPQILNGDFEDRWFILKALNPVEERQDGK